MAKIKKDTSLRKSILQAAITGQLISDVEGTTETGKQLLDKIIEERNAKLLAEWEETLKKNPKAKKPAPIVASEIDEDEIPFEIPENWCWCRLGDLVPFGECENADPNEIEDEDWILDLEDIEKDSGRIIQFKKKKETESKSTKHIFREGNVLYSKLRPYLNKCVIAPKDGYCTSEIIPLDFGKFISNKYAQKFLMSPYFVDYTDSLSYGVKMPRLGTTDGNKALIPLPPLAVQNAIVAKLEEVLPLVDAYENAVLEKEELKTAFPDKVKKAILQEAITGKLTEDWRKTANITEGGKQLLDRIITERNAKLLAEWEEKLKDNPKAKKPTLIVSSEIDEEEIPFEVPDSWCWCRLGDVCLVKGGKRIPAGCTLTEVDTGHKYIRVADMKNGSVNIDTVKYITDEIHDKIKAYKISKDDVYITVAGTIGDSGIIPAELDNANLTENADKLVLFNGINKFCLHFFISSSFFQEQISDAITKVGQPKLAIIRIQNFLIPLPPLAEQEKIVEIIEQMLPLCEKLGG